VAQLRQVVALQVAAGALVGGRLVVPVLVGDRAVPLGTAERGHGITSFEGLG
jgi:hypothetical protein